MTKFFKKNYLIILIVLVGFFLRVYKPLEYFAYGHDQDLAFWVIKDMIVNHHIRLIGQETSSHGIFIGPYFYYLQIPFYVLAHMDPSGSILLPVILGTFTIFSIYFVAKNIFNLKIAYIASFIYAISTVIVFTDREIAPTMPVVLWTVWFMFAVWQILHGKRYAYIIIGILVGLIWSLNLQLVILLPLILLAQCVSGKPLRKKELLFGVFISIILNVPFFVFEVRHGFQQMFALVSSVTTAKDYIPGTSYGFLAKLDRVMQIVYTNSTNIFWNKIINIPYQITFWILNLLLLILIAKKKINIKFGIILLFWEVIYILFFAKISLNISEYYLNGMNIIYILLAASGVNVLIEQNKKKIGYLLIILFAIFNLYAFFIRSVSTSGYIARKDIITYIKKDAIRHNYPCVSLSYITSPGNDLGYRYFVWEQKLKTKPVVSGAPVYSIVFPLSKVNGFDKSFESLGLVLPSYNSYNDDAIQKACEGEDYTLTEPVFGFTK